jgi:hypothetical protein
MASEAVWIRVRLRYEGGAVVYLVRTMEQARACVDDALDNGSWHHKHIGKTGQQSYAYHPPHRLLGVDVDYVPELEAKSLRPWEPGV